MLLVLLPKVVLDKETFCLKSLTADSPPEIIIGCWWHFNYWLYKWLSCHQREKGSQSWWTL